MNGQPETQEWHKELMVSINQLNHHANLLSAVSRALNANQAKLRQEMQDLRKDVDHFSTLDVFNAFLMTEMQNRRAVLEELAIGLQQGRTNTVLLAEIFRTQTFNRLAAKDVTVTNSQCVNKGTALLTIGGHVRTNTTKVFRVKHINFYRNWTDSQPIRHEYVGKLLVIKNSALDCVKAIDQSTKQYVEEECTTPNGRDQQLKLWRKTKVIDIKQEIRHSQYIRAEPDFIISCWGNTISYTHSSTKKFVSTSCPNYAFKLNNSYTFRTSDNLVQHVSGRGTNTPLRFPIVKDIADVRFEDSYIPAHQIINEQTEHILSLVEQNDAMRAQIHVTRVAGNDITWRQLAITGGSRSGMIFVFFLCTLMYYRCKNRVKLPEFNRFWLHTTGEMAREVERQLDREIKKKETELKVQVQHEVSKQITDNFKSILVDNLRSLSDQPRPARKNIRRASRNLYIEEL